MGRSNRHSHVSIHVRPPIVRQNAVLLTFKTISDSFNCCEYFCRLSKQLCASVRRAVHPRSAPSSPSFPPRFLLPPPRPPLFVLPLTFLHPSKRADLLLQLLLKPRMRTSRRHRPVPPCATRRPSHPRSINPTENSSGGEGRGPTSQDRKDRRSIRSGCGPRDVSESVGTRQRGLHVTCRWKGGRVAGWMAEREEGRSAGRRRSFGGRIAARFLPHKRTSWEPSAKERYLVPGSQPRSDLTTVESSNKAPLEPTAWQIAVRGLPSSASTDAVAARATRFLRIALATCFRLRRSSTSSSSSWLLP